MTDPIKHCPQPDPPELVRRADGYHYQSEDEMKELTDEQIYKIWYQTKGIGTGAFGGNFARAVIAADRALNATDRKLELLQQAHDRSHAEALRLAEKLRKYESENAMHLNAAPAPADQDVMRETLEGIANANQRDWAESERSAEAFKVWAQNRARYALDAAPTPPAEQGEQYPVAQVLPGNGFLAEVPNGLPPGTKLYTHRAPDVLATLRAKVEALPTLEMLSGNDTVYLHDVLAEIDKMGGGV